MQLHFSKFNPLRRRSQTQSNKPMKLTTKIETKIERFSELLQGIVGSWVEAGKLLVEMIEEDVHVKDRIMERLPGLSPGVLTQLEAVGRGVLHERLLTAGGHGMNALKRMPYSDQVKHLEAPVEMVVENGDSTDVLLVSVENLTSQQAAQVFASDHIRTTGEQKAWLVSKRMKSAKPMIEGSPAWHIKAGRVIFHQGASFTAGELASILTQVTK